jgi:hypothetical protein
VKAEEDKEDICCVSEMEDEVPTNLINRKANAVALNYECVLQSDKEYAPKEVERGGQNLT